MRCGVAGWLDRKVKLFSSAALPFLNVWIGLHRFQKPRGGEGVVAGPADHSNADRVGLQFLLARKVRQLYLVGRQRDARGDRIAEYLVNDILAKSSGVDLGLTQNGMVGDHVAHLVGDDRGDFR